MTTANVLLDDVTLCDTDKFEILLRSFVLKQLVSLFFLSRQCLSVFVSSSQRVLFPNKAFKGRLFSSISLTNVTCFEISGDTICGTPENHNILWVWYR